MFVKVKEIPHKRRKNSVRKILVIKCDHCGILKEKNFVERYAKKEHHFCSVKCVNDAARPGGALFDKKIKTSIKNYGSKHPHQSDRMKKIVKENNLKKYGVEAYTQTEEFKQKMKETMLKRYGVEYTLQSEEIKNRARQTKLKRYGNICNLASEETKKSLNREEMARKQHETKLRNGSYREAAKKRHSTMLENNQYPIASKKRHETKLRKGSYLAAAKKQHETKLKNGSYQAATKKIHETMKKNGTYKSRISKPEEILYKKLCLYFGKNNVEQQVLINDRWAIDFYVKPNNIYIQVDGVYWHGLNRPLEIIKEFKVPRDRIIYKKYLTDREQDKWFTKKRLNLVRVTDHEISSCQTKNDWSIIEKRIERAEKINQALK